MRQREFRESTKSSTGVHHTSGSFHHYHQEKPQESSKMLEEIAENDEDTSQNGIGESTPALEAVRKAIIAGGSSGNIISNSSNQISIESKYSSKVQFRAPDIIEL